MAAQSRKLPLQNTTTRLVAPSFCTDLTAHHVKDWILLAPVWTRHSSDLPGPPVKCGSHYESVVQNDESRR